MSCPQPTQVFLDANHDFRFFNFDLSGSENTTQPCSVPQNQSNQQAQSTNNDHQKTSSENATDYEMHYGTSQRSVKDVLEEILEDVLTHKNIHNWDSKLVVTPFKKLETVIRSYLATCSQEMLNDLLIHSLVEEVVSADGTQQSTTAIQENGQANGQFFFSKEAHEGTTQPEGNNPVSPSRGRIMHLQIVDASKNVTHIKSVRLQDEDNAYIRQFIERHLNVKAVVATPFHWQPTSPPEIGEEHHQKHYRRVSVSFHLAYLAMSAMEGSTERHCDVDRTPLFALHNSEPAKNTNYHLFRTSASILLTLVIPEVSITREEEIGLLRSPQGLWTVLMINYPRQCSDRESDRHLTPTSQFTRGISAALVTQRYNAESIYEYLSRKLQLCDRDGLFDDSHFTKSKTYHRTIQACHELKDSLDSTFRFMEKLNNGQLKELRSIAHPYERPGVEHWTREMHEVLYSMRELRIQIEELGERALESRAALHGATAVLEARTALQQGQRLKVLAYLATLYLPLTATSSLYSMSVLPNSASFASFFVVFTVLLLSTLSPSIYLVILRKLQSTDFAALRVSITTGLRSAIMLSTPPEARLKARPKARSKAPYGTPPEPLGWPEYIQGLIPRCQRDHSHHGPPRYSEAKLEFARDLIIYLLFDFPKYIAFYYLIPELGFPMGQYQLYKMRGSPRGLPEGWRWHPLAFLRDIIRALLLPFWAIVIAGIIVWLVLMCVLGFLMYVLFCCCCCR